MLAFCGRLDKLLKRVKRRFKIRFLRMNLRLYQWILWMLKKLILCFLRSHTLEFWSVIRCVECDLLESSEPKRVSLFCFFFSPTQSLIE